MTKFILHGGFTRKDNELNRAFNEEVMRDVPDGGTVLLVYFASRSEDPTADFEYQAERFKEQAKDKNLHFVLATKEGLVDEVKRADAVYMHGGSTNKLLAALRTYPDIRPLIEGKTIAGSSAGAYAIARYGASHSANELREGMGWAPLRVVCHYGSPDLPPHPDAVSLLMQTAEDLELVLLKDCEWKAFTY